MDFNVYLMEFLVRERLREAQRLARTSKWVEEAASARRRRFRVALGRAMIRAGRGPALGR